MNPQLIAHYRLLSKLGAGGMGEVYRATDTKLGRDVAIKMIPAAFAQDADRMARFTREAQMLAALNHPNIAQIYGVEERALVMELVEGATLAERIAQGPVPLEEALPIARQIAEALEYAHERGIVHRDLKPANVKITPEGRVKVLDFGLAKALANDPVSSNPASSPTLTMRSTVAGVILGTAAYMPPEQAKGKEVDRRADIWAFGVVLAEMLTGLPMYRGETASEVLAAVIMKEPDLSGLPAGTPAQVRKLLARCLDKDPQRRLQAIGEARIAIEEALSGNAVAEVAAVPAPVASARGIYPWIAASVLAVALAALALVHFREKPPEEALLRFSLSSPERATFVLTGPGGSTDIGPPVLSPDGRRIAFNAHQEGSRTLIWLRSLDRLDAQPITGTEDAMYPFWSADGRSLAFFSGGKLKKVDAAGGPTLSLCDATRGYGGAWNQEGIIVFSSATGPLQKVSAAGGVAVPVTTLDPNKHETSHRWPWFLPDGRHFLYLAVAGDHSTIRVGSLDGGETKTLFESRLNAIYAQGHLLFMRETTLMAQPFDAQRLLTAGDAVPVAEQIRTTTESLHAIVSASQNGFLVYATGTLPATQLTWFDRKGKATGTLGDGGTASSVALSSDRRNAAASLVDPGSRNRDIWIFDVTRGLKTRFTFDPADERQAAWSPNGRSLVFNSNRTGHFDLFQKQANGVGNEELVLADSIDKYPTGWSPDGKFLLYNTFSDPNTKDDIWVLPIGPERSGEPRKPFPFAHTACNEDNGQFSPDGRWIAYESDESQRKEIYVAPFPGPGGKRQISIGGGIEPRWRKDGKEIYYISLDLKLMAAAVNTKADVLDVGVVSTLFAGPWSAGGGYHYDVSADGQHFLVRAEQNQAVQPLTVVQHWTAGLK